MEVQRSRPPAPLASMLTSISIRLSRWASRGSNPRTSRHGKHSARADEHFRKRPGVPPADLKVVVRVNFDTLYSIAWLDLTKESQIVSLPDTGGRFYLMPMLDTWTDVFASPGWRTTGTQAANFLLTPPGWSGAVPEGLTRINAPTPYVWINRPHQDARAG